MGYREKWDDNGRLCTGCDQWKPWAEFGVRPRGRNGKKSRCLPCEAFRAREDRVADPEARAKEREYETRNAGRITDRRLMRTYGLTAEELAGLRERQNGKCAICNRARALVVDHCHASGKARELLCSACNNALGMADDDTERLRTMIAYLERHKAKAGK